MRFGLALLVGVAAAASSVASGGEPEIAVDVRAWHESLLVLDSHLDTAGQLARPGWSIMDRHDRDHDLSQVDHPRLVEGGVDGGFWALFIGQGPRSEAGYEAALDDARRLAGRVHEMVKRYPAHFALARTAADAARIASGSRIIVYLSMENAYPLGLDPRRLDEFHALGVRMIGLVHSTHNDWADSSLDRKGPEWGGLSRLGRELVTRANRLGVVIDGSHASDDAVAQMIELSATPIVLSHSGCRAVFDHPRNVPDELLRRLAAKGGVIQVNAFSAHVASTPPVVARNLALRDLHRRWGGRAAIDSPEEEAMYWRERRALEAEHPLPLATFDQFMAHVLHALAVVGPEHVGISGDFDGGGGVQGFEDVTGAPRVTAALLAAGYDRADIAKIWGGNLLRVLAAAAAHAER